MTTQATDFWQLEKRNRRKTILLVVVFLLLLSALGFGFDFVIGDLRLTPAGLAGFPILTLIALALGSINALTSYYGGAALVLASVHARQLAPDSPRHQTVLDVIEEMRPAARMPPIRAYVIDDPAPNAFATGRDPAHSVICVTQGLIDQMDREELQGVLGHEMAHIRDYDIRTMTMIAVMVGGIAMLADFINRWVWYGGGMRSRRERDRDDSSGQAGALIAVIVIVLAILAPILTQILAMAVSREREYLADAASVEFTRNPHALLRALERIAATESPLQNASRGTAHLFIVNPLARDVDDDEGFFANLLSTHPPLKRRIARLQALLGTPAKSAELASTP